MIVVSQLCCLLMWRVETTVRHPMMHLWPMQHGGRDQALYAKRIKHSSPTQRNHITVTHKMVQFTNAALIIAATVAPAVLAAPVEISKPIAPLNKITFGTTRFPIAENIKVARAYLEAREPRIKASTLKKAGHIGGKVIGGAGAAATVGSLLMPQQQQQQRRDLDEFSELEARQFGLGLLGRLPMAKSQGKIADHSNSATASIAMVTREDVADLEARQFGLGLLGRLPMAKSQGKIADHSNSATASIAMVTREDVGDLEARQLGLGLLGRLPMAKSQGKIADHSNSATASIAMVTREEAPEFEARQFGLGLLGRLPLAKSQGKVAEHSNSATASIAMVTREDLEDELVARQFGLGLLGRLPMAKAQGKAADHSNGAVAGISLVTREPRVTSSEVKSFAKGAQKIGKSAQDGIEFGAAVAPLFPQKQQRRSFEDIEARALHLPSHETMRHVGAAGAGAAGFAGTIALMNTQQQQRRELEAREPYLLTDFPGGQRNFIPAVNKLVVREDSEGELYIRDLSEEYLLD